MERMRAQIMVHRVPIDIPIRTSFGVMHDRPSVLVRIEDADGRAGWGEVWCNYPTVGAEHRARLLKSVILPLASELGGFDKPGKVWTAMTDRLRVMAIQTGEFGPFAQCLAGLECALQDLAARQAGTPLWRHLSDAGSPDVCVYASGINPADAGQTARRAAEAGYAGAKIKIGFDHEADRSNLLQARELVGPTFPLMADANQAWTLEQAVAFAPICKEAGLDWVEEPLCHDAPDENWRALARHLQCPLAAGENFFSMHEFTDLPRRRDLGILQPDVGKWGGVARSLAIAASTTENNLLFCPHWLGGGIGLLTSLHVKAASGTQNGYVEVDFNVNPMREHLVQPLLADLQNGLVTLSEAPGIGAVDHLVLEFNSCRTVTEEIVF